MSKTKRYIVSVDITEHWKVYVDAENEEEACEIVNNLEIEEIRNNGDLTDEDISIPKWADEIGEE